MQKRKPGFCAYCLQFTDYLTRDHVLPRASFPKPRPILMVCQPCNSSKGSKTLQEWLEMFDDDHPIRKNSTQFLSWTFEMFRNFKQTQQAASKKYRINQKQSDF